MNGQTTISFKLNGVEREFMVDPDEKLAKLLRRVDCKGVKEGCDEGTCGACTVIMDGKAVYSCIMYAWQAAGREVWTIEGIGSFETPHALQSALVAEGAVQCGYCIPGMILSAKALMDSIPSPTDEEIRENIDGNLCRCTGYEKIWNAIRKVRDEAATGNSKS